VAPARELGGRAILVRGAQTEADAGGADGSIPIVASLAEAVDLILAGGSLSET
jgi:hypothetical protein